MTHACSLPCGTARGTAKCTSRGIPLAERHVSLLPSAAADVCVICTYLRHVTVGRSHDITCLLHAQRMGQAYLPEKDPHGAPGGRQAQGSAQGKGPAQTQACAQEAQGGRLPQKSRLRSATRMRCALCCFPLPSILSAHSFTDKACWTAVQFMRHRALPMTSMLSGPEASCAAGTCCCYGPEKEHMLRL